jgi:hypothetical protein
VAWAMPRVFKRDVFGLGFLQVLSGVSQLFKGTPRAVPDNLLRLPALLQRSKGSTPAREKTRLVARPRADEAPERVSTLGNAVVRRETVEAASVPRLGLQKHE